MDSCGVLSVDTKCLDWPILWQTLTDRLCKELGEDVLKLRSEVFSLSYNAGQPASQNWSLTYANGRNSQDLTADAVIMTVRPIEDLCSLLFVS